MQLERLEQNYRELVKRLGDASAKWGMPEICAVTKTVDVESANMVYGLGIHTIGENRVQEVLSKRESLNPGLEVHLIGSLQTNKVRHALPAVNMIQSLDRMELLNEIDKRARSLGLRMPVLIQVNIAKETQKSGVFEEDLVAFARETALREGVRLEGLMSIMPLVEDPEEVRPYFKKMRGWFERLRDMDIPGAKMRTLSMGMSNDAVVASEEGSTMVRVGRTLFGERA